MYFGGESGYMRNLIERLAFPALRYDATFSSVAEKHFPVAFVYTMNRPLGQLDSLGYPEKLGIVRNSVGHLLGCGEPEALYVCDTWQFDDYEKYDACGVDVIQKQATRASQFPRDCQAARELGMRLAKSLKPGK